LSSTPGKHEVKELQKTAIFGTAPCGKYCCRSTKEFNIEDNVICTTNSKRRIAATLYTLGTWFVSGV
jgi:hypothetical protein